MLDSPLKRGAVLFVSLLATLFLLEYFGVTDMGYAWSLMFAVVFAVIWTALNTVLKRGRD